MAPKNNNYEHNLYYTQHKWLPHFFYGATAPLMKEIQTQKGQFFVDLFHAMHQDEPDYICPISKDDFSITSYIENTQSILHIVMPEPLGPLYCRSTYLCHDTVSKAKAYYTVEQTSAGDYYICLWTSHGAHAIYTEAPDSTVDELACIRKYFYAGFDLNDMIALTTPPANLQENKTD